MGNREDTRIREDKRIFYRDGRIGTKKEIRDGQVNR
jgi:hypothetical protein